MGLFDGGKIVKVASILNEWQRLQDEKRELCMTLKGVRGKRENWRDNIAEDKRTPVKILYKELVKVENELSDLLATRVIEYPENEDESFI